MKSVRLTLTFRTEMSEDQLAALADKVAEAVDAPSVRVRTETRADVYRNADHTAVDFDDVADEDL